MTYKELIKTFNRLGSDNPSERRNTLYYLFMMYRGAIKDAMIQVNNNGKVFLKGSIDFAVCFDPSDKMNYSHKRYSILTIRDIPTKSLMYTNEYKCLFLFMEKLQNLCDANRNTFINNFCKEVIHFYY